MKWGRYFALIALLLLMAAFLSASAEEQPSAGVFRLPPSVRVISEDAFRETAASTIYLPESVETIEERAFADMPNLRDVYIPPTTTFIGEASFEGAVDMTVHGVEHSAAQDWAEKHGYRFVHDDVWMALPAGVRLPAPIRFAVTPVPVQGPTPHILYLIWLALAAMLLLPKLRPEMYPVDYDFP